MSDRDERAKSGQSPISPVNQRVEIKQLGWLGQNQGGFRIDPDEFLFSGSFQKSKMGKPGQAMLEGFELIERREALKRG